MLYLKPYILDCNWVYRYWTR